MKRLAMVISCAALVVGPSLAAPVAKPAKPRPAAASSASGARGSATALAPKTGATLDTAPPTSSAGSSEDSSYTLKGGQEGTVFKTLTVQGEDIERPALRVDLDPSKAPGLEWGSARDVLDRTQPDLGAPLVASSQQQSDWVGHPWLSNFASGAVARFRPDLKGVERWKLTIVNARGEAVATYQGRGEPPREIAWDGRSQGGAPVVPGLTYSYVLEAHDKAGNKRNFVGQGFSVNAYRLETADGPVLAFSGRELPSQDPRRPVASDGSTTPILIEAATWMNQAPNPARTIRVTASARSYDEAQALATRVAKSMAPHLVGDPARVQTAAEVRPDAPEGGTIVIACVK